MCFLSLEVTTFSTIHRSQRPYTNNTCCNCRQRGPHLTGVSIQHQYIKMLLKYQRLHCHSWYRATSSIGHYTTASTRSLLLSIPVDTDFTYKGKQGRERTMTKWPLRGQSQYNVQGVLSLGSILFF